MTFSLHNIWLPAIDCNYLAKTITISNGSYQYIGQENIPGKLPALDYLEQAIAFPGLVNSHDHLDFNVFPTLKSRIYQDYVEWGHDIHRRDEFKCIIEKLKNRPLKAKIIYGLIKNIICGVTTVINHGAIINELYKEIDIIQNCTVLHSYQFEKWLPLKINLALRTRPITIHLGEGNTSAMHREIDKVLSYNLFNKEMIGIHGITLNRKQARRLKALIWCPESNHVLYGSTAAIKELYDCVPILFGTDSTLTSHWNIWEHLRLARRLQYLTDEALFDTLTTTPATIWNLPLTGKIAVGNIADLVIAKRKFDNYWETFYALQPEDLLAVFKRGQLVCFDDSILNQDTKTLLSHSRWSKIRLGNSYKYLPASLIHEVKQEIDQFNILPIKLIEQSLLLEN